MMLKKYKPLLLIADIIIFMSLLIFSFLLNNHRLRLEDATLIEPEILLPVPVLIIAMLIVFKNSGLYRMQTLSDSYHQLVVILKSILIGYGVLITSLFFLKHPLLMQRRIIIPSFLMMFVLIPFYRILFLKYFLRFALKKKIIGEKVVIVGAGSMGRDIVRELITNQYSYFTPVGFFDDKQKIGTTIDNVKVLDLVDNIQKYSDNFDEILIALTNVTYNELQEIINTCRKVRKPMHVISDLYRIIPEKLEVEKFDGISTFQVPAIDGLKEYAYLFFKHLLDYTVALMLIILFLPLWILIAVLIKMGSEGPVLYKAEVIGQGENKFVWYKFRSMFHDNDDAAHRKLINEIAQGIRNGEKLQNDTRITSIGKWLRKYSLDEFPQLINILKGQMSLVGPRPVLPYEYEHLDDWQKERFSVLPGMTGLWQIRGRNKVNFADQHVLDLYYVRNRSILLDMQILFNTVGVVISGRTGV